MNFNDYSQKQEAQSLGAGAIIGIILASVFIVVVLILLCCYRRKQKNRRSVPTKDEMDRMWEDIIRRAENDEKFCSKGRFPLEFRDC